LNRSWIYRLTLTLVVFSALLLGTSGCAGGSARATSWTGLTVAGERLYFADLQQIAVINAADGDVLWTFPANPKEEQLGSFYVTPAVDETHVIVASEIPARGFLSQPTYAVWAIDPETHRDLWHFDDATAPFIEGGAIGDGIFLIGNSNGYVYGLDVETGAQKWPPFRTEHRVWATPLIVDDTVYVGSMDRHLYALRLSDGKELWRFPAGGSMTDAGPVKGAFASMPVLREDTLYVGAFDDRVYAIDAATGRERWRFEGENWFWGSPAVHNDVVYVVDVAGNVYALEADSGERVWYKPLDAPVRAGPALAEDGSKLFIGSENGTLYALDTSDGFVMWSREDEGQVLSAPVVDGSVVYESRVFGSFRLRALHVDNGRDIWVYPPPEEG
jgi:outer membrane protein assembly factor BamB